MAKNANTLTNKQLSDVLTAVEEAFYYRIGEHDFPIGADLLEVAWMDPHDRTQANRWSALYAELSEIARGGKP